MRGCGFEVCSRCQSMSPTESGEWDRLDRRGRSIKGRPVSASVAGTVTIGLM